MNAMIMSSRTAVLLLASLFVISSCSQSNKLHRDPVAQGKASFNSYCVSCHGENATGNGPAAEILTVKPTDLTQLKKNNNGRFPADKVYATIDGREVLYSHGTREMPIWGNIWRENDGKPRPEEEVLEQISEIVEYIRSIQHPASGGRTPRS